MACEPCSLAATDCPLLCSELKGTNIGAITARGRDSEVFPSSLIKLKSAIRHIHRSGSGIKNSPATPSGSGITVEEAVGDVHGSGINILDTTSILITGSSAEIDRNSRDVDRT